MILEEYLTRTFALNNENIENSNLVTFMKNKIETLENANKLLKVDAD